MHEDFSLDLSKPDGYRVGVGQAPSDSPVVELTEEQTQSGAFRSTHDQLAGIAFDLEATTPSDLTIRLTVRPAAGSGTQIAAEASLATARLGQLFVLFDAPISASRGAFSFTLESPHAVRGRAPVFRTSAPGAPSFRLLHR